MTFTLDGFLTQIVDARRQSQSGRQKPHKLLMLLTVLELADEGLLTENRILFSQELVGRFEANFRRFSDSSDWCQPSVPFFHLRSSDFWFHKIRTGREVDYGRLSTSGGGTRRIAENIEYAYLSEKAYALIQDQAARAMLRLSLESMLDRGRTQSVMNMREAAKPKRLTTAFSETLGLSRPGLSLLLRAYVDAQMANEPVLTENVIRQKTGLGPNHVTAQKNYARGCDLADATNRLTDFGEWILDIDPELNLPDTQWLLHYHFVAPHGNGPEYWQYLTFHTLTSGSTLNRRGIAAQIARFHDETGMDRLSASTYEASATAFLSTYANADGLGALNLLKREGEDYRVGLPEPISNAAFAYVLADFWSAQWGETQTVSLSRITGVDGPSPLLLLNSGDTNEILTELHMQGILKVERSVRPYTVFRLWSRMEEMRDRLYDAV